MYNVLCEPAIFFVTASGNASDTVGLLYCVTRSEVVFFQFESSGKYYIADAYLLCDGLGKQRITQIELDYTETDPRTTYSFGQSAVCYKQTLLW